jgi:hypothetical protein
MAARFDASGEYLQRTANLPIATAVTICGWAWRNAHTGTFTAIAGFEDTAWPTNSANWTFIGYLDTDGLYITSGAFNASFPINYGNGVWFFWAIVCQGTGVADCIGYAARPGDELQVITCQGTTFTLAQLMIGNDTFDERFDGRLAGVRVWDAALSRAELEKERRSRMPVRLANLNAAWPLKEDFNDYSGNGRHLTQGGTVTLEEDPAVPLFPLTSPRGVKMRPGVFRPGIGR